MKPTTRLFPIAAILCVALSTAQASDKHVRAFDAAHSTMTVYAYKEGLFAFAADNHEINAPILSGSLDAASNKVEVTVDAAKMVVLDPKMPAGRRAQVQANMTSAEVLDVQKYPKIAFTSTSMKAAAPGHYTVDGELSLHGQTHPVSFDVTKTDANHFTGSTMVRQTEFGITPIRIAGGTVRVKDDVKVEFAIALKP